MDKYYKLGNNGSVDYSLLRRQALTFTIDRRRRTFTDDEKTIPFCHSLRLGLFRPLAGVFKHLAIVFLVGMEFFYR